MEYITNNRCYKPIKGLYRYNFRLTYKTKCKAINKMNIGYFLSHEDPTIMTQTR